jgi:hypothetical protein
LQFLRRRSPGFHRALLIESGSRELLEAFIPWIYENYGAGCRIDLVTCYAGAPQALNLANSALYRVTDYPGPEGRSRLLRELLERNFTVVTIICSGEPIMFKWKLWLIWKLPLKVLILNENGDFFWFDRTQWRLILHFALFRAGLSGEGAAARWAQLLLFPLTLTYLLAFAGWVHLKRRIRMTLAKFS